jgi:hypothetical protein
VIDEATLAREREAPLELAGWVPKAAAAAGPADGPPAGREDEAEPPAAEAPEPAPPPATGGTSTSGTAP